MEQINKDLLFASTATLLIDQQQAQQQLQLEYLGYDKKNIFLRFFHHLSDPRKDSDKRRRLNYLHRQELEAYQQPGCSVYAVANGVDSGREDQGIKQYVIQWQESQMGVKS